MSDSREDLEREALLARVACLEGVVCALLLRVDSHERAIRRLIDGEPYAAATLLQSGVDAPVRAAR